MDNDMMEFMKKNKQRNQEIEDELNAMMKEQGHKVGKKVKENPDDIDSDDCKNNIKFI